ncbi:MAG: hypothetical protein AAGD25_14925 [Cyanobacteria bacterium P01_F01_bin.150]
MGYGKGDRIDSDIVVIEAIVVRGEGRSLQAGDKSRERALN